MLNKYFHFIFKQIKEIKEESQELMKKVIDYRKKVTNEVEACYNTLMLKGNELQKVQTNLNHLIQNSHVTEKVKQRKGITDEVSEIKLDEAKLSKPQALCHAGKLCIIICSWLITTQLPALKA